jgi:DNA helicase-2/ATP-dependent DNA helicase PcrA
MFEVMQNIDKIDLKLNSGTKQKFQDFVTMIQSFQVINENQDAFISLMFKKNRFSTRIKRMPHQKEWQRSKILKLLNGIKDFTEGQKEIDERILSEFMEDVA